MENFNYNYSDMHKPEFIDQYPIAMAYVPWQKTAKVFDDLHMALMTGTIFPELTKPFTGRRCVK
ncbi:MAG: spore coat associated protein CotJA [Lachnospiraceae bacterium]|nr:spore coat associated protein CotJA [Lachnospiraceae bacterium]